MVHQGFNSDINVRGKMFHVQTEDWGAQNPYVVSRIFCNGAVVKTIKTPYENVMKNGSLYHGEAVKNAVKKQHSDILDQLFSGQIP